MSLRTVFLFTFLLVGVVMWVGCKSEPKAPRELPEPMELPAQVTLDFGQLPEDAASSPFSKPGASLDQVLVLVSEASAVNFTYSREVGEELAEARVDLTGKKRLERGAIEGFLQDLLQAHGFELKSVGPQSIRVWMVQALGTSGAGSESDPR